MLQTAKIAHDIINEEYNRDWSIGARVELVPVAERMPVAIGRKVTIGQRPAHEVACGLTQLAWVRLASGLVAIGALRDSGAIDWNWGISVDPEIAAEANALRAGGAK